MNQPRLHCVTASARKLATGLAAFAALAIVSVQCSDLTAPAGVNTVSILFRNLTRPDTLGLTVGDRVAPSVLVTLGSPPIEQNRARYVFSSTNPAVLRVYASGDSIEVTERGDAQLVVTLVGTTIGSNYLTPGSRTADTVTVIAAAAANSVIPATVNFGTLGRSRQLQSQSVNSSGQVITGANVVWRSANPGIVSVDAATGVVTAMGNGATDVYAIFARVDSVAARVTVAQTLDRYDLTTPATPTLRSINETMTVQAIGKDSLGNNLVAGSAPAPAPTFQSLDAGKVEIDPSTGVMTARSNTVEPVVITANVSGVVRSDTLLVSVRQVATSVAIQTADTVRIASVGGQLTGVGVLALDALGTQVPASSIVWTSTNPTKAIVEGAATATITAQDTGRVKVAARADQASDTIVVIVTNDPANVVISPKPLHLRSIDESATLTATVTNASGAPLTNVARTWISRDSSIVQPQPQEGVVVARAVGETRIVVQTSNGRSDSVTVRVTNAPDTVRIIPDTLTFASAGDSDGAYAVDFKNARGVALPRSSVAWTSADPNIATVAVGTGTITAQGAGLTYVLAVSPENSARRDSVYVRVTNAAASIRVSPDPAADMTAIGETRAFTATVYNAANQPVNGATIVWSVPVGAAFVTIDPSTGIARAIGNGTATIRATSGTITRDVQITVAQAISLGRSTIVPTSNSIPANGTGSTVVTVQLKDANDNNITYGGSTVALYTTRGTFGAVTDAGNGRYTATLTAGTVAGTATVTATVNGNSLSANAVVTFTAGAPSQYLINATSFNPTAGTTITVGAQLADANNNPIASGGSVVTWSSTGGGSFSSGTSTTNANGQAFVQFTTASNATTHVVTATTGSISGSSQPINPVPGGATNYFVSPASTSPAAGTQVVISAQLRDANGNAVGQSGTTVTWSKSDANGSFSSATSVTNGFGIATVTLTTHTAAGTSTTVTATSAGPISGTSATITTVAGTPTQMTLEQAPSATAQNGVAFTVQPRVQLRDANNNPVTQANINVTATISAGGGSLNGATTVQTDANGVATFTDLAITGTNGARTLRFSASGAAPVTAPVTLTAGPAASIVPASSTSQSAVVGQAVTSAPSVQVRDASGNPVANHAVTFAITSGGGSFAGGPVINTDANGYATLTSWTLGTTSGSNALSATASGLAGSPISFIANGTPAVVDPGMSTVMRTGPDNVAANGTASSTVTVILRDQYGNAIPGKSVSLSDGASSSTIAPASATSNASGIANFTVTNTVAEVVTYTATASDPGAITLSQTATVTFGNSAPVLTAIAPSSGNVGQTLDVVFSGSGFQSGITTVAVGSGITVNNTTVASATQLTANITISSSAASGARNFTVSNAPPGGGTSSPQIFTVNNPAPGISSVSPNSGLQGQTNLQIVITGSNFVASSAPDFNGGSDVTVNSHTVDSPTQITASISISSTASTGNRNLRVVTPSPGGGNSPNITFTIGAPPAPTLASVSPATIARTQTVNLSLTGTGFATGVSSVNLPAGVTLNSLTVTSSTQMTANVTVSPTAALGATTITVSNTPAGGTSAAVGITIDNPAPTITSVNPDVVTVGLGGATVPSTVVLGSGFISGVTVVDFVQGDVTISGTVTVNSSGQLTITNIDYPGTLLVSTQRTLRITNAGQPAATHVITLNP